MLAWFNRERLVSLSIQAYVISAIGIIFMGGALISSPSFQKRINSVEVGFEGGYEAINKASSSRLPLWGTAIRMFQDNYVNGVGVRSFRYAYPDYAEQDDPFVNFSLPRYKQTGQTHAHQVVLEFASDTGVVGLIGYFIVIYMLYFWLLPVVFQQKYLLASGYMIAVTVGLFPINTHQSFFSSHWGQIIWMLIALGVSSLTVQAGRENFTLTKMKLMRK
jgi:O-antigen ligase